jgi:probable addiction module antidote protein
MISGRLCSDNQFGVKLKKPTIMNARFLREEESQVFALSDALESENGAAICAAFLDVARSRGIAQIARETGLSETQIYAAFTDPERPDVTTLSAILDSLLEHLQGRSGAARK